MTVKLTKAQKIQILNADDIYSIMQQVLLREKKIDRYKEHFWLACLNSANELLMVELISLGSSKSVIVEPVDVFSFALQKKATKVIMVHNHPSGELHPSKADEKITEKMVVIGLFLDLPVIDHLIISTTGYYSFQTSGLLQQIQASTNIDLTFKMQEKQKKEVLDKVHAREIKMAKQLLKIGLSIPVVVKATGLTIAEIERLLPKKKK